MTLRDLCPDAMNHLSLITDSVESAGHVSGQLAGIFETHSFQRQGISDAELEDTRLSTSIWPTARISRTSELG
jgi:hypothetical protein